METAPLQCGQTTVKKASDKELQKHKACPVDSWFVIRYTLVPIVVVHLSVSKPPGLEKQ